MKFLSLLCMAGLALATPLDNTQGARIIGGEQVAAGDIKFIAQVEIGGSEILDVLPNFQCGAAILNVRTVLTGADCGQWVPLIPLLSSRVRVGSLKRGQGGQRIQVIKRTVVGAFAVLRLARNITMGEQAAPINLYSGAVQTDWRVNVAGWGESDGVAEVDDLQKVTGLSVRTNSVCQGVWNGYNSATMFCAGYHSGGCGEKDYGGPVYLENGELAGIIASEPNDCQNPNQPRYYYRVSPYFSQIQALL